MQDAQTPTVNAQTIAQQSCTKLLADDQIYVQQVRFDGLAKPVYNVRRDLQIAVINDNCSATDPLTRLTRFMFARSMVTWIMSIIVIRCIIITMIVARASVLFSCVIAKMSF